MKLTKETLKQIIKEEIDLMKEGEQVADAEVIKSTIPGLKGAPDRINPIVMKWIEVLLSMDPSQINSTFMNNMLKKLGEKTSDAPATETAKGEHTTAPFRPTTTASKEETGKY